MHFYSVAINLECNIYILYRLWLATCLKIYFSILNHFSPDERRNYKNVIDALIRITKEEGFLTLWRGSIVTLDCSMIVSGVHIVSFIHTLSILVKTGKMFFHQSAGRIFWFTFILKQINFLQSILKIRFLYGWRALQSLVWLQQQL